MTTIEEIELNLYKCTYILSSKLHLFSNIAFEVVE